jgi:hypothetical protein
VIQNLPAVHSRKSDIQDEEVRCFAPNRIETGRSVFSHVDVEIGSTQTHLDQPPDDGRVLYDQDSMAHAGSSRPQAVRV